MSVYNRMNIQFAKYGSQQVKQLSFNFENYKKCTFERLFYILGIAMHFYTSKLGDINVVQ